jgi:hypothetical protein
MGKRGRAEDPHQRDLIEDRLLGSCLCSAESTSVVAASAVGVLGSFQFFFLSAPPKGAWVLVG